MQNRLIVYIYVLTFDGSNSRKWRGITSVVQKISTPIFPMVFVTGITWISTGKVVKHRVKYYPTINKCGLSVNFR